MPLLAGCSGGGGSAPARILPPAVASALSRNAGVPAETVAADNAFAFSTLAGLRAGAAATDNVFLSPTSLSIALDIAYNGARGDTQTGMAQALDLGAMTADTVNGDNAALQASLVAPDPAVTLNIANSLWLRSGSLDPTFVSANQQFYGSQIGDVSGAPANVNAWVNQQTAGKIETILPDADYSQALAILVNAVYFNATWTTPFDPSLTADAPFTNADGSTAPVKTMHAVGSYSYFKGARFQALRLPYGTGRLGMVILLPDTDSSLNALVAGLTPDAWTTILGSLQTKTGSIAIPRVTSSFGAQMNDTLKSLGMTAAFDPSRADFTGIAKIPGQNVYLQGVYHKTFLRIDEKGTEAAAATGVTIGVTDAPQLDFQMSVNRPFLCALVDEKTGIILFIGTINHPV
ncbi:MAG TPA: serpin family protein [Chthonomonadaceae bacterium]|nr:serpin family protein [Chthonomonadaceae bacterium]